MKNLIKRIKKGFTIVELVVVIAVIAIIAAVTIPTFTNIIRKAQISADVQLCKHLNTILANAEAEGRIPSSVYDVLYLENEGGYILANLNPTADKMYFAWDSSNNEIIYLTADLESVYYPEDYTLNPEYCYITVGDAEEAQRVADKGFNLALENDIEEEIVLHNVVSIDTLGFKASNVTFDNAEANVVRTAYLVGEFGEVGGNIGGSSVIQSGSASSVSVTGSSTASVTVNGSVNSYSSTIANSTISSKGTVTSVTSGVSIVNNGIIKNSVTGASVVNNGTIQKKDGENVTTGNKAVTFMASSKEDLENLRYQVMSSNETFKDRTVELESNINLNNISFCPISSYYRKGPNESKPESEAMNKYADSNFFQGTFDGKNYTIDNFSNLGFSITGLTANTNSTSASFGADVYNESIYGLFASVSDATIKNITINCNIDMVKSTENKMVGDSVGGLVGFSYGDLTVENVTVNGTIKAYDGVGGIVGRAYSKPKADATYGTDGKTTAANMYGTITLKNVTNNANVTGVRHTGGIIGYISGTSVVLDGVKNNGNVECLGWKYDEQVLGCTGVTHQNCYGYYVAGAAYSGGTNVTKAEASSLPAFAKFTQNSNAKVIIAGKECDFITNAGLSTGWTDKEGY